MTTTADAAPDTPPHEGPNEPLYAEVVVDARTGKPGDTFTYSIPPHVHVGPGHLVRVPFGPRTLNGVVTGLREKPNVDYTRPSPPCEEQPLRTRSASNWGAGLRLLPAPASTRSLPCCRRACAAAPRHTCRWWPTRFPASTSGCRKGRSASSHISARTLARIGAHRSRLPSDRGCGTPSAHWWRRAQRPKG